MPRKTIFIFIAVFVLVGGSVFMYSILMKKPNTTTEKTDGTSESGYQSFNPFGSGANTDPKQGTGDNQQETPSNGQQQPNDSIPYITRTLKLHKIVDFAVAGATFFEDTRLIPPTEEPIVETVPVKGKVTPKKPEPKFEIVPALRYVERVTGHIYEMYLDTNVDGKISNSTIPSIYEAIFDGSASTLIYRYLSTDSKEVTSFMATLGGAKGEFLPSNITDISISPDKTKFFYLIKTGNGAVGTTRSFKDTKKTQVFTSPFSEWISQWVSDQKIYLTSKASYQSDGTLFSLNTTTGTLTKVFGGIKGLTTLANKDGSLVLYSASTPLGPKLGIFNVNKHTAIETIAYGLPEKCVWSDDGIMIYCAIPTSIDSSKYPDLWYQGITSFNDQFVRINTNTNEVSAFANSTNETPVDATHLFLNKTKTQLFFINKKDSTLWSVDL